MAIKRTGKKKKEKIVVVTAGDVRLVAAIRHEYEVLNRFSTESRKRIEIATDIARPITEDRKVHVFMAKRIPVTSSHPFISPKIIVSDRMSFPKAPATKAEKMERFRTIRKEILSSKEATTQFMKDAGLID